MRSHLDAGITYLYDSFMRIGTIADTYKTYVIGTTPKMKHNQTIGHWGEETAVEYLGEHDYEIVARNARTPYGEIDIIAKQHDIVIFIEVKTLTSSRNFFPEQNVTARKREHMLACAQHYAAEHAIDHWQIDVIAVEGKPGGKPNITYFENAI